GSEPEEPEDEEDADESYSDDDDMSWKVRRAAAKCVEALVTYRTDRLYDNYNDLGPLLIGRFKEREESVRYDVFQGYAALLRQTRLFLPDSVVNTAYTPDHPSPPFSEQKFRAFLRDELGEEQRRVFEALEKQIPQLMRAINRQLKAKNLKTRHECFVLLSHLLNAIPGALKGYFAQLTGPIQASMADKASDGNMKINTLHFVTVALNTHEPATLYPHVPVLSALITEAVKDSFYKIAAEALIAVQSLIRVQRPQVGEEQFDYKPFVPSIHDAILSKLKIADIDQEVKERTIVATGLFIATFADNLPDAQLRESLAVLLDRLRNEMTRHVTVKALNTVVVSPLRIDLSSVLPEVLPLMADFLRKNQRALRISTLTLLTSLVAKFAQGGLENSGLTRVAKEVPALISEQDLQISQLSLKFMADLISAYPDQLSDSLQALLTAVVTITQSSLLQGATLQAALSLLTALVKSPLPNKPSFEVSFAPVKMTPQERTYGT
ncbi:Cullin-associated NEDD8-dissociated protein 1, partial [Aphelenchoides avenae]